MGSASKPESSQQGWSQENLDLTDSSEPYPCQEPKSLSHSQRGVANGKAVALGPHHGFDAARHCGLDKGLQNESTG